MTILANSTNTFTKTKHAFLLVALPLIVAKKVFFSFVISRVDRYPTSTILKTKHAVQAVNILMLHKLMSFVLWILVPHSLIKQILWEMSQMLQINSSLEVEQREVLQAQEVQELLDRLLLPKCSIIFDI